MDRHSTDVIHHFFGACLGVWLAYTLVENKSHSESLPFILLILIFLSFIVFLLASAFKYASDDFIRENDRLNRILLFYSLPVFLTLIGVLIILFFAEKKFEDITPSCQLWYLFFVILFWVIVFEFYHSFHSPTNPS